MIEYNEFNEFFKKDFYTNDKKEVIIKGLPTRLVLSESEQKQIIEEVKNFEVRILLGEDISKLERLMIDILFNETY